MKVAYSRGVHWKTYSLHSVNGEPLNERNRDFICGPVISLGATESPRMKPSILKKLGDGD